MAASEGALTRPSAPPTRSRRIPSAASRRRPPGWVRGAPAIGRHARPRRTCRLPRCDACIGMTTSLSVARPTCEGARAGRGSEDVNVQPSPPRWLLVVRLGAAVAGNASGRIMSCQYLPPVVGPVPGTARTGLRPVPASAGPQARAAGPSLRVSAMRVGGRTPPEPGNRAIRRRGHWCGHGRRSTQSSREMRVRASSTGTRRTDCQSTGTGNATAVAPPAMRLAAWDPHWH